MNEWMSDDGCSECNVSLDPLYEWLDCHTNLKVVAFTEPIDLYGNFSEAPEMLSISALVSSLLDISYICVIYTWIYTWHWAPT